MRKLMIAEGRGTVEIRGRRATVRLRGRYVGQAVKLEAGRWALPGSTAAYPSPSDAAEVLAEDAHGQAA